jgi:hypothetical protein
VILVAGSIFNPPPYHIVIALESIPPYTTLTRDMLAVDEQTMHQRVASRLVHETEIKRYLGGMVIETIHAGEPLRRNGVVAADNPAAVRRLSLALTDPDMIAAVILGYVLLRTITGVVLGAMSGPLAYWGYLGARRDKTRRAYQEALARVATILRDVIGRGGSLREAIAAVARRGPGATQGDFEAANAALASGEALEKALEPLGERRRDPILSMLLEILLVHREHGGGVKGVLAGGRFVAFDAKSTRNTSSWRVKVSRRSPSNDTTHQWEYLSEVHALGGLAFYLIYAERQDRGFVALMPFAVGEAQRFADMIKVVKDENGW